MNYHLRPFSGPDDFPGMADAHQASAAADEIESTLTAADLERGFRYLDNCDPLTDLVIAETGGRITGFTRGTWWDDPQRGRMYQFRGALAPEARRQGVGTAMLRWMESRLREIAGGHPPELQKFFLSGGVPPAAEGTHALFIKEGYSVFRNYHSLLRPNLENIEASALPSGLEVRPADPAHFRAIWKNIIDSSRDEWPPYDLTETDYQAWLSNPNFQPDLWQVAWDIEQDVPVGHVLTYIDHAENEKYGRKRGYTEGIGVDPAWRRRGVARALISLSLQVQKQAGMTESALAADAGSANDAARLYQSCGFKIQMTDIFYAKAF